MLGILFLVQCPFSPARRHHRQLYSSVDLIVPVVGNERRKNEALVAFPNMTHVEGVVKGDEGVTVIEIEEVVGVTLGDLLKGPETNTCAATALVNQLLNGEQEAGTVSTNYTKSGRKFRNRLHVGPLVDESGRTSHCVGVSQAEPSKAESHYGELGKFDFATIKAKLAAIPFS
jgi:hypothetical protein